MHKDIQGFICYSMGNPNNILGLKRGIISYAIYHKDGKEIGYVEIPKKQLRSDGAKIWQSPLTTIEQRKKGRWRVCGKLDTIKWDLWFSCVAPGKNIHVDLGKWLLTDFGMDWSVFCNSARVKGDVTIHKKRYYIECVGYHDSNYGRWIPSNSLWIWGNCIGIHGKKIVSFSLGESRFRERPIGHVYLSIDEDTYQFDSDEYHLRYDTSSDIPFRYHIRGNKEDGMVIKGEFKVERIDKLILKVFDFVPLLNLYLQRGTMTLYVQTPDGETYVVPCKGAWEIPKKPSLFLR